MVCVNGAKDAPGSNGGGMCLEYHYLTPGAQLWNKKNNYKKMKVCRLLWGCRMKLGQMDPRLVCSGPMSTFSYDSHPVSRYLGT